MDDGLKKAGRPHGAKAQKKKIEDVIGDLVEKNLPIIKKALAGNEFTDKEKTKIIVNDLMPYAAKKKSEKNDVIPEHLKTVRIVIKGYKPHENPFDDKDEPEEVDEEGAE
jgi:hypothetical protein